MEASRLILKIAFVGGVTALAVFSPPAALLAIAAAVLAALHGKADSIVELTLAPLRARLDRAVTESEQLVARLRAMVIVHARIGFISASGAGKGPNSDGWQFDLMRELETSLRNLDIPEADIASARADVVKIALVDLEHAAAGGNHVPLDLPKDAQWVWASARHDGRFQDPDLLEQWLTQWGMLTDDRRKLIEDMRWIKTHGDFRDRDQFLRFQGCNAA